MSEKFDSYEQAVEWLYYGLPRTSDEVFKGEDGFKKTKLILDAFQNPQNNYKTIHIAGTSGKGTVAKLISDILVLNNRSIGTIMSPHVYDLRERFLVNGSFVDQSLVEKSLSEMKNEFAQLNNRGIFPTYFEATLVLSYLIFARYELDYVVVETGVGGLLDGTNLVSRDDKLALITAIGMDHTEILGDTVEKIASQKAGIITKNVKAFAVNQSKEINAVISRVARAKNASLDFVGATLVSTDDLVWQSKHQQENSQLATVACRYLADRDGWDLDESTLALAKKSFKLPGRFELRQVDDKTIILDGAHNEQKTVALVETMGLVYPGKNFSIIFGCSSSKNAQKIIHLLEPIAKEFIFTTYSVNKSDMKRRAQDFSEVAVKVGVPSVVINEPDDVVEHLEGSDSKDWLVTGSFFVVSEIGSRLP